MFYIDLFVYGFLISQLSLFHLQVENYCSEVFAVIS